jgi:hypothetical protein
MFLPKIRSRASVRPASPRNGAGRAQLPLSAERRGEKPPLLDHRPLLVLEELGLVDAQVEEARDWQEDQQDVEEEEPDGDPGRQAEAQGFAPVQSGRKR